MMIDIEKFASTIADGHYEIENVLKLIIQPHSALREFRTRKCGFLYTISGEAIMEIGDTVYELKPGSLFHAAPGAILYTQVKGHTHFKYYLVFYKPNEMTDASAHYFCDKHFSLKAMVNPLVPELLMQLHQHNHPSEAVRRIRAKELFMGVMYQFLLGSSEVANECSEEEKMIEKAVLYIRSHYMHTLTLDELAAIHAMNPKSFSYYFHKLIGKRPIDYLIDIRLDRACQLLELGQYSVHDIATSVGYANPLYFSRVFKKKYGIPPSEYMNKFISE